VTQYSAVQCLDSQHAGGDVTVGNGACVGVALYLDVWYTGCGTVCVAKVELFACIVAYLWAHCTAGII
jgi:hypothetical protein